MNYILFDPPLVERFYPLTLTRPLGEMRVFGGTIKDYWEEFLGQKVSYLTCPHLSDLYPTTWADNDKDNVFIPTYIFPPSIIDSDYFCYYNSGKPSLQDIQKKTINNFCINYSFYFILFY